MSAPQSRPHAVLVLGIGLLSLASGCKSIDSKAWNLGQLHDEESRHRYHGALESDIEYVLRHDVASALRSAGASFVNKDAGPIENPSLLCLENMVDLERYPPGDVRARSLQVEWMARLAVADPSKLCRERAVLALGPIGAALKAGTPRALPAGTVVATADAVAEAAAGLVRGVRAELDPKSVEGPPAPTVDAACAGIEALVLDVDGGRRALDAVAQMWMLRGLHASSRTRLAKAATELEKRLVSQALGAALRDGDPIVRAAAIEASVDCAGIEVVDSVLQQLDKESSALVLVRLLAIIRERGLPPPPKELPAQEVAGWRDLELRAIYQLLVTRPESELHVAVMLTLSRLSGAGFESLREEDWQAWFRARNQAPAAGATPSVGKGSGTVSRALHVLPPIDTEARSARRPAP